MAEELQQGSKLRPGSYQTLVASRNMALAADASSDYGDGGGHDHVAVHELEEFEPLSTQHDSPPPSYPASSPLHSPLSSPQPPDPTRTGPARRSLLPLSTGAGTFVGWWAPTDDERISHTHRSLVWAESGGSEARCLDQAGRMRRVAEFGWRGGDGVGPTTMTLQGSLAGMQRRSRADYLNLYPNVDERTSTWQMRHKASAIVGDGAHLPFQMEPRGKTLPWQHPLSGYQATPPPPLPAQSPRPISLSVMDFPAASTAITPRR